MKTIAFSMNKTLMALALAFGAVAAAPVAQAQAAVGAPGARIGFINTDRLFSESRAAVQAQAQLKQEFSGREHQLQAQGDKLKAAVERFQKSSAGLGATQRAEQESRLMAQDAEFQQKRREFQDDLNNRKNEELQKLLDRANQVVVRIAKEEHFDVILQEAVYVDRRLDITDKVIAALNAGN